MQILTRHNKIIAYSEAGYINVGTTAVCVDSGECFSDATISIVDSLPTDINIYDYFYIDNKFIKGDIKVNKSGTIINSNNNFAGIGEWADGNPEKEDRLGYFVSVDENSKIIKANSGSKVWGVSINKPAISTDITEDKFEGNDLKPRYAHIGWYGYIPVIDDGACVVGERCIPSDDGIAIPSTNNFGYQVISRINENHIVVLVEPQGDELQKTNVDIIKNADEILFLRDFTTPTSGKTEFTTKGTRTWACPNNVTRVSVYIQGGGQGGQRGVNKGMANNYYTAGCVLTASSGRAVLVHNIKVTPGERYAITVGGGGAIGGEPIDDGDMVYFGPVGAMGESSSAFGYTSDDEESDNIFVHQYVRYRDEGWYSYEESTSEITERCQNVINNSMAPKLVGSTRNRYVSEGVYSYKNGAVGKISGTVRGYNTGFVEFNSGAGNPGIVIIYYNNGI